MYYRVWWRYTNKKNDDFPNLIYQFDNDHDFSPTFESLDIPISDTKILKTIKKLCMNKSPVIDNVLYEYFKVCVRQTIRPLNTFFIHILNLMSFPRDWTSGMISPFHKKYDQSDPNNYRGWVTLTSCLYAPGRVA